jgi:hypothetical protein
VCAFGSNLTFRKMLQAVFAVVSTAISVGSNLAAAADSGKAQAACKNVFALMDRQPVVDALSPSGVTPARCTGRVEFRAVCFAYPWVPTVPVLKVSLRWPRVRVGAHGVQPPPPPPARPPVHPRPWRACACFVQYRRCMRVRCMRVLSHCTAFRT